MNESPVSASARRVVERRVATTRFADNAAMFSVLAMTDFVVGSETEQRRLRAAALALRAQHALTVFRDSMARSSSRATGIGLSFDDSSTTSTAELIPDHNHSTQHDPDINVATYDPDFSQRHRGASDHVHDGYGSPSDGSEIGESFLLRYAGSNCSPPPSNAGANTDQFEWWDASSEAPGIRTGALALS